MAESAQKKQRVDRSVFPKALSNILMSPICLEMSLLSSCSSASPILPLLSSKNGARVAGALLPIVNWARAKFGLTLPWKKYREELCRVPCLDGRSPLWLPWFKEDADVLGYYLDEDSRTELQSVYADLKDDDDKDEWITKKMTKCRHLAKEECEMALFFRAWFMFPRIVSLPLSIGCSDDDDDGDQTPPMRQTLAAAAALKQKGQSTFIPRAFVSGQSILLPYIWLVLADDGTGIRVKESTLVSPDYRIALASSEHGYSLAQIHLPVYANFPRALSFTTPPVKERTVHFENTNKPYLITGGSKALLASMIEEQHPLNKYKEDEIWPRVTEAGNVCGLKRVDFHIDVVIRYDDATGQFDGVSGIHSTPLSMYYVLVEHKKRMCLYSFHADNFRGPGEETGLDLHYPHPLIRE